MFNTVHGVYSCNFSVRNGFKQGGIIGPILFCFYFDAVLRGMHCAGLGCKIGKFFVMALACAYDLVLLSPLDSAIRRMLAVRDNFAR
jgi:hypothetical protein